MHSWYNNLAPEDPAMQEMYRCVGRALWEWSKLELNLCDLFHELNGGDKIDSAHEQYFNIHGSKPRLNLLKDKLNEFGWSFRDYDFYKSVIHICIELVTIRNSIAHGVFVGYQGENVVDVAGQRSITEGIEHFLSISDIERFSLYLFELNRIVWYSFEFMLIAGQNENLTPSKQLVCLGKFSI